MLVRLAEAPEGRMRFSDLARSEEWEPSRMSHQVSRMTPRHGETVRRLFVDLLIPEELEALCRISRRVLEQWEK